MTDVMKYQIVSAVFFQIILCLIIIHGVYRYFGKENFAEKHFVRYTVPECEP